MFVEAREGPARCPVREQQQAESSPCTAEPRAALARALPGRPVGESAPLRSLAAGGAGPMKGPIVPGTGPGRRAQCLLVKRFMRRSVCEEDEVVEVPLTWLTGRVSVSGSFVSEHQYQGPR